MVSRSFPLVAGVGTIGRNHSLLLFIDLRLRFRSAFSCTKPWDELTCVEAYRYTLDARPVTAEPVLKWPPDVAWIRLKFACMSRREQTSQRAPPLSWLGALFVASAFLSKPPTAEKRPISMTPHGEKETEVLPSRNTRGHLDFFVHQKLVLYRVHTDNKQFPCPACLICEPTATVEAGESRRVFWPISVDSRASC